MIETSGTTENITRTGHFIFRVRRLDGAAWNWMLRVEVIETGQWGVFDSIQDALRFMREHMAVDEDVESDFGGELNLVGEAQLWLEGLEDEPGSTCETP